MYFYFYLESFYDIDKNILVMTKPKKKEQDKSSTFVLE